MSEKLTANVSSALANSFRMDEKEIKILKQARTWKMRLLTQAHKFLGLSLPLDKAYYNKILEACGDRSKVLQSVFENSWDWT